MDKAEFEQVIFVVFSKKDKINKDVITKKVTEECIFINKQKLIDKYG